MKNHQYLTSGVLEAYLLGLVSEQEKEELERLLATDEEVLAQLNELETDMEAYFLNNAVPPPPGIREKIELRINETEIKKWQQPTSGDSSKKSSESRSNDPHYVNVEVDNTHIRVHKHWKIAFIAVFILSKIFLITGLYFYFKANSLEQEVIRLKAEAQHAVPLRR
ncbi:hypothetical protein GO730_33745 [Spirosoma sp. HMF3257]|uniref:Anti-sigma factor n=1 Tax=Spirosoma telluris TaxID=2183553 RepID=A0A327NVH2_9BACT|nr:hypothetical protein [Spirosoma telluris]RAI77844.1 hypothetical protein HMF3257_33650 [Spirosoma telluris]